MRVTIAQDHVDDRNGRVAQLEGPSLIVRIILDGGRRVYTIREAAGEGADISIRETGAEGRSLVVYPLVSNTIEIGGSK